METNSSEDIVLAMTLIVDYLQEILLDIELDWNMRQIAREKEENINN
jgi:hypothetical protein